MDRLFLLGCGSKLLFALSAIVMIILAAMSSWWTFICAVPAIIAMCGISYCRIKEEDSFG